MGDFSPNLQKCVCVCVCALARKLETCFFVFERMCVFKTLVLVLALSMPAGSKHEASWNHGVGLVYRRAKIHGKFAVSKDRTPCYGILHHDMKATTYSSSNYSSNDQAMETSLGAQLY